MIYLKQNIFSVGRQTNRENCNLFIFLNKQTKPSLLYIMITLLDLNLVIMILVLYVKRCNYIVIDKSKNRYDCGNLRINWDWRVLKFNNIYNKV